MLQLEVREDVQQVPKAGREVMAEAMNLIGQDLWGQVREEAPVDHGRLAGSFTLAARSPLEYVVATNVEYALDVHEGRGPTDVPFEDIAEWAGRKGLPAGPIWYTITNEGTQENRYGDRAIEETESRVDMLVEKAANDVLGRYDL